MLRKYHWETGKVWSSEEPEPEDLLAALLFISYE
jgi:hypothetical protein